MTLPPDTKFATRLVHAGLDPDPSFGSIIPAIHQVSTYVQQAPGEYVGDFDYARSANPTRTALENALGELEGGHASAFASGLAATHALITAVARAGSHIVLPHDLYGGTFRLVDKVLRPWGLDHTLVDQTDLAALEAAIRDDTVLIWVESPTNPRLQVIDVEAVVARARGALVAVDNTFATPVIQRPLELGADVVVHSTTKYLGGHSDTVGGAVIVADQALHERVRFVQNAVGAVPGPLDCFLVLRGVKTLAVRMERHCANAAAVVDMLERHPAVAAVRYPGLPTHPGHEIAARQMRDFGGMVSFTVAAGEGAALDLVGRTRLFTLAESLGAVESLIEHPGRMTHASVAGSELAVDPSLVRLSVGLETADDLVDDLRQALDSIEIETDAYRPSRRAF
jgi:cystathionine gamma-synthase